MPEHFPLAGRAWLPVALASGRREFVRPCDITSRIDGQEILRVATGRPDCDISLTEFLIGLLTVAIGPNDDDEWFGRFGNPPSAEELLAALKPFEDALVLDGDGPRSFQDRETLDGEATPISGLLIDAPGVSTTRDNADHFVKRGRTNVLSRAGAAIMLATLQTSAPSGGAGHRTSLRGGGPLTTLVVPGAGQGVQSTLWQRLWANVPKGLGAAPGDAAAVFPWLGPTRVSDKAGLTTTPTDVHAAQAFFGLPRRIRLVFEPNTQHLACDLLGIVDDVIVTSYITRPWGTNYTAWDRAHPLSPYYKPKPAEPTFLPVHLQSSRVGYREWLGMAVGSLDGAREPARCVADFSRRAQDFRSKDAAVRTEARLLAAGYAMDNMKPLDFGEALMPLIVGSSPQANEQIRRQAEALIKSAELIASQLVISVKIGLYGERAKADRDSAVLLPVRERFWADTEEAFYSTLKGAATAFDAAKDDLQDKAADIRPVIGEAWRVALQRHALRIFDEAVPIDSADSKRIEDVINGRKLLLWSLTGYGAMGQKFFKELGLSPPEKKAKKGSKGA